MIYTCAHGHAPNGCDKAGCRHNPQAWTLHDGILPQSHGGRGYAPCANHNEVPTCGCGANTQCRACGSGRGQSPCECDKKKERVLGLGLGSAWMREDFDAPLELLADEALAAGRTRPLEELKTSVREWANTPHPIAPSEWGVGETHRSSRIIPMGAPDESTELRRIFHQVEAPERRPGSLDLPAIAKRARLAVLRGDADRDGVRALGRDILLLLEETSWPH